MANFRSVKKVVVLVILLAIPPVIYLSVLTNFQHVKKLPYYGPREVALIDGQEKEGKDTIYHSIPPFQFVNQEGKTISESDFDGKIYVTDFFFTTCPSICPKMAVQLKKVQDEFKDFENFSILSHTVDPERDSVSALAAYADKVNAIKDKWHLVTGSKKELYEIARKGYFLTTSEGDGGADDFIHSPMFILVDKERSIRGYYDGTNPKEVEKLIGDIKMLITWYYAPRK